MRMTRFQWLASVLPLPRIAAKKSKRERREAKKPSAWVVTLPDGRALASIMAHTKGEARAIAKRRLGRLPSGTVTKRLAG